MKLHAGATHSTETITFYPSHPPRSLSHVRPLTQSVVAARRKAR
jgi:hypothetical protein